METTTSYARVCLKLSMLSVMPRNENSWSNQEVGRMERANGTWQERAYQASLVRFETVTIRKSYQINAARHAKDRLKQIV
jgi:hypothetical protein